MRKAILLLGLALTLITAGSSTAFATNEFECDGVYEGGTFQKVTVPRYGACTLIDSVVTGDVHVLKGAFFQSTGATIRGHLEGRGAQTIFLDTGSVVRGHVRTRSTIQVYLFFSTVVRSIEIDRASDAVQICANRVSKGSIEVTRSGTEIRVGDPLTEDCPGNIVRKGDVSLTRNFTDVEFVVRGNTISSGDLTVYKNTGPVPKFVQNNTGGNVLRCARMSSPFSMSGNSSWVTLTGQCA
jgi:hypothetical protein